jgi:hypothetical protein
MHDYNHLRWAAASVNNGASANNEIKSIPHFDSVSFPAALVIPIGSSRHRILKGKMGSMRPLVIRGPACRLSLPKPFLSVYRFPHGHFESINSRADKVTPSTLQLDEWTVRASQDAHPYPYRCSALSNRQRTSRDNPPQTVVTAPHRLGGLVQCAEVELPAF